MQRRLTDWLATAAMLAFVPTLLFIMAGAVLAARPTSSVWIYELATSRSSLALGGAVTVGYVSREREPWVVAECRPNASTVYSTTYADGTVWSSVRPLTPGVPATPTFWLGESVAPLWTAGGADCSVSLVSYNRDLTKRTELATASFTAAP